MGALGLALGSLALGLQAPAFAGPLALTVLLGVASGLLIVPLNAVVQWRAPPGRRGAVIALANVFVFGGALAGSLTAQALSWAGLSPRAILVAAAVATTAGTLWALGLLPDALLRLPLVLLTHSLYRVRVIGRQHVPGAGGALLVPNQVSFADGLFLIADRGARPAGPLPGGGRVLPPPPHAPVHGIARALRPADVRGAASAPDAVEEPHG